jgi:hypothetical protein
MCGPKTQIRTCASTAKGRERPPLFARPAARKVTRGRSRPFLRCAALCIRPHGVRTAASNYKPGLNRPAHRSPKNIFQIRWAFFLSRIFPTRCPLVEIEGRFFPCKPTRLPRNHMGQAEKWPSLLRVKEKHEEAEYNFLLFEIKKIGLLPHISHLLCLFIDRGHSRRFPGIVSERFGR